MGDLRQSAREKKQSTQDRRTDQSRVHLRGERFCFRTGLALLPPFCRSTVSRAPGPVSAPDLLQKRTPLWKKETSAC